MTYIGDANDTATILYDANIFFTGSGYFKDNDTDEASGVDASFDPNGLPQCPSDGHYTAPSWSGYGQLTSALVQVYDLVASIEPDQALPYFAGSARSRARYLRIATTRRTVHRISRGVA